MASNRTSKIIRRIERDAGVPNLSKILVDRVKPTDLQSLLLETYRRVVQRRSPGTIFSDYVSNRFTLPSQSDPATLLEWDRLAFSHLPDGFHAIELSPVSPIGSASCVAPVSQDWVLTTIRNMEVVSDPTNMLALECALRRQKFTRSEPTNPTPVHLACSHRAVRAQRYQSPSSRQHFRLFSLCSAGRDTGNLQFELQAMAQHIGFYLESVRAFLEPTIPLRVTINPLSSSTRNSQALTSTLAKLKREFDQVDISIEEAKSRTTYYQQLRFHIHAGPKGTSETELVDGGDTDWTRKFLNNAKERLIISGIGSERLCEKFAPQPSHIRDQP